MKKINKTYKVLFVDDNTAIKNILQKELRANGFTVLLASDGKSGLKVAIDQKPDLIILDIIMPIVDGLQMLRSLRGTSWGKTVPVIVLSNDDNHDHITQALIEDATDYLIKSDWKIDEVIKKVKETLNLI